MMAVLPRKSPLQLIGKGLFFSLRDAFFVAPSGKPVLSVWLTVGSLAAFLLVFFALSASLKGAGESDFA